MHAALLENDNEVVVGIHSWETSLIFISRNQPGL